MKQHHVFVLLLIAGLWSCNKTTLPPNVEEDPIFTARFTFGQQDVSMSAGKNDLFMHTSASFSLLHRLRVFSGVLAPVYCPTGDCNGSFRFDLLSRNNGNQFIENQSIVIGKGTIFDAFQGGDTTYTLSMSVSAGGGTQPQFSWEVGSVPPVAGATFSHTFPDAKEQSFLLMSSDAEGFRTSLKSPVFLDGRTPCPVPVLTANLPKGIVSIDTRVPAGDAEVDWVGGFGAVDQPIVADDQQFVAMVKYPKQLGCFLQVSIDKLPSNSTSVASTPSVNYQVVKNVQDNKPRQLGSATFQWVDEQGKKWRTDLGKPNANSQFEIESMEDYTPNAQGQATLKLKLKINAQLYDGEGNSRQLVGTAVIAVAK